METEIEVNAKNSKYVVMSWDQNAGPCHNTKIDNRSFERMVEFSYLGTNLTKQSSIQEEIKSMFKLENVS